MAGAEPGRRSAVAAAWRLALGWGPGSLLLCLLLAGLVQARALASLDGTLMTAVVGLRPAWATRALNWVFRLGYAPLDVGLAVAWAGYLLARRRSVRLALLPLFLAAVVGVQGGLRLAVDRASPMASFAIQRSYASQAPVRHVDQADAAVRQAFAASTGTAGSIEQGRGSYPSGHAARVGFLCLLAMWRLPGRLSATRRARRLAGAALAAVAALVGYSTLYFGYHWPSDVLGGYLLGLGVLAIAGRSLGLAAWQPGGLTIDVAGTPAGAQPRAPGGQQR